LRLYALADLKHKTLNIKRMMIVEQMLNNAPKPLLHIADVSGSALFNADCMDILPLIPDKSVQLILADLPYGTTQCKWDSVLPLDTLWTEYERIITDKGAMIFTASQPFTTILTASNINHFKYSLVWVKTKATGHLDSKKKPMKKHEDILVFCKNGFPNYYPQGLIDGEFKTGRDVDMEGRVYGQYKNHKISKKGNYPKSVLEIPNPSGKGNQHPTAKPVDLMKWFIEQYSLDGDMVLDNTMGSGTTCLAAKELNRKFIGIEKEPKYYEIACQRCGF
jgi:site-specific DNA-methyltransferase (adenine-specific)